VPNLYLLITAFQWLNRDLFKSRGKKIIIARVKLLESAKFVFINNSFSMAEQGFVQITWKKDNYSEGEVIGKCQICIY